MPFIRWNGEVLSRHSDPGDPPCFSSPPSRVLGLLADLTSLLPSLCTSEDTASSKRHTLCLDVKMIAGSSPISSNSPPNLEMAGRKVFRKSTFYLARTAARLWKRGRREREREGERERGPWQ